jgi:hypothetical protein
MNAQPNKKNPPEMQLDNSNRAPMFSDTFVKALSEIFFDE